MAEKNGKTGADTIIKALGLAPLPGEGGYFKRTYTSTEKTHCGTRPLATAIYYLLTREEPSKLHRLPADEVIHYYTGARVALVTLYPDGRVEKVKLGDDIANGERPQAVVPAGAWIGMYVADYADCNWALLGTTMSPGFIDGDIELADIESLLAEYPSIGEDVLRLTHADS